MSDALCGSIVIQSIQKRSMLSKYTKPSTIGEVRHQVGLLGYYRRYIHNLARTAKPLYDLLNMTNDARTVNSKSGHLPSSTKIHWTQKQQESLEILIRYLTSPPVMAYPKYSKPYIVHTLASNDGLGAILHQKQHGKMRLIPYASQTPTPPEKNYHVHAGKLKFLALKLVIHYMQKLSPSFSVSVHASFRLLLRLANKGQ